MKRSGKLLDAIGQIDDRYIMEAADLAAEEEAEKPLKKTKVRPMRKRRTAAVFAGLAACAAVAVLALDQEAAVLPFTAKTEEKASLEAAVPQAAAELPDEAAPYAYTAEGQAPRADTRMVQPESEAALRSVPEGAREKMEEAPAAKVFASDIQADASLVTCTLVSEDPENTLLFGEEYYLEYLTENGWKEIAPAGEIIRTDAAYKLEPGGSLKRSWNLEMDYGTLESGQYRIGIPCEESNGGCAASAVIYVEFGI